MSVAKTLVEKPANQSDKNRMKRGIFKNNEVAHKRVFVRRIKLEEIAD
jgi:hypothetical protein